MTKHINLISAIIAALYVCLILQACATNEMTGGNLKPLVGKTTYEEIVTKYGPPASKEKLSNGKIMASWSQIYSYGGTPQTQYNFTKGTWDPGYSPTHVGQVSYLLTFYRNGVLESVKTH